MTTREDDVSGRDDELDTEAGTSTEPEQAGAEGEENDAPRSMDLEVTISDVGPCKKHVLVVIPAAEIERQYDESLGEMKREAQMPGFRPGKAPVSLVLKRYRKEVKGQVKSTLVMGALEQLDRDYKLNPIAQPELDLDKLELPEEGSFRFEMDVEVQPEFALPQYKGLSIRRPVRPVLESDVDAQVANFLERYAQEVPKLEGGAELGDIVVANILFFKDTVEINRANEVKFRFQRELRFQDGRVENLGPVLEGARPGDQREGTAQIGSSSPDAALRGQEVQVRFEVLDLKTLRLPELSPTFLATTGFESETELRDALSGMLERRFAYQQRSAMRREVLDRLVEEVPFDLPADLVKRQERENLRREIFELREAGMTEREIRAREAEIRANTHENTLRSLKELFILTRISDAEEIKVEEDDLEQEILKMAERSDESPRRIRARIEKEGLAESLATQILQQKTMDRIIELANVEDVSLVASDSDVETIDESAAVNTPEDDDSASDGEPAQE